MEQCAEAFKGSDGENLELAVDAIEGSVFRQADK